jgi:hypothetical protein
MYRGYLSSHASGRDSKSHECPFVDTSKYDSHERESTLQYSEHHRLNQPAVEVEDAQNDFDYEVEEERRHFADLCIQGQDNLLKTQHLRIQELESWYQGGQQANRATAKRSREEESTVGSMQALRRREKLVVVRDGKVVDATAQGEESKKDGRDSPHSR